MNRMARRRRGRAAALAAALVLLPVLAFAQEDDEGDFGGGLSPVPIDPELELQAAKAASFVERKDVSRALDVYQSLVERTASGVVPLKPGLYVSPRELCHARILALGPEGIELYRLKYGPQARRLLEQGVRARDIAALRDVWQRFRCTAAAAPAFERAGDFLLDEGRFREAAACWSKLLQWTEEHDLPVEPRVYGKAAVVLMHLGETPAARAVLARGADRAAGRRVRIAGDWETLEELSSSPRFVALDVPDSGDAPDGPPRMPTAATTRWEFPHDRSFDPSREVHSPRSGTLENAKAPSTPIPIGALAAFRTRDLVAGLDLVTGKLRWESPSERRRSPSGRSPRIVRTTTRRGTVAPALGPAALSAFDGRIFGIEGEDPSQGAVIQQRGGQIVIRVAGGRAGGPSTPSVNVLSCWDGETGKRLWTAPQADDEESSGLPKGVRFLWPPVGAGDLVIAPVTTQGDVHLTGFDPVTGAVRWRTCVFSRLSGEGPFDMGFTAHTEVSPPVVDEGVCVLVSNRGAVAAVETETGAILWIAEYARTRAPQRAFGRGFILVQADSNARAGVPILHHGRVFAAPADSEQIVALDLFTGETLWTVRPPFQGPVHLLGALDGAVVAGGKALFAVEARTGKTSWVSMEFLDRPAGTGVLGRGFALYPAGESVYVVDLDGGKLCREFKILGKRDWTLLSWAGQGLLVSHGDGVACYDLRFPGDEGEEKD